MTSRGVCAAICAVATGMATLSWAQVPGPNNAITDVPGIKVGHFTANQTGTTVVLAGNSNGQGVAGGITQRGGSPGTRETDPMYQQIYRGMRGMILNGAFASGARLPATRALDDDLGVSRNIVLPPTPSPARVELVR